MSNIKIIQFDGRALTPQRIQVDIIVLPHYDELSKINSEFLIILDSGWNFSHDESVSQLIKDMENNGYTVGVYADSMINNAYKNNLPFDFQITPRENIMSGILIKQEVLHGMSVNSTQDIIKMVGQKYMLYRSPNILFKYES